jgi:hypothetical protein
MVMTSEWDGESRGEADATAATTSISPIGTTDGDEDDE